MACRDASEFGRDESVGQNAGMRTNRRKSASQRLAVQAFELSLAAPQVVAHRVARMAKAGIAPSARDRAEFTRMGAEKVGAFYESWAAMWARAFETQVQLVRAWMALPLGVSPRAAPRAAGRAAARSAQALTALAAVGLAPVHSKAVANARRLARRGRR